MIEITINKKKYKVVETIKEITISQAARLQKLEMPDKLEKLFLYSKITDDEKQNKENKDKLQEVLTGITDSDIIKVFPKFYGEALSVLSNIPQKVIDYLDSNERTKFYEAYLQEFVTEVFWNLTLSNEIEIPEYFKFNRKKYYFPKSLKIADETIPNAKEPAITFIESSDIMMAIYDVANKGIEKFSQLIAVYARQKGEEYDSNKVIERAKEFEQLPLIVAIQFFFVISDLTKVLTKNSDEYLEKVERNVRKMERRSKAVTALFGK
jgi:hypothetical protein